MLVERHAPILQTEQRFYNSYPSSVYALPADATEGKRLDLQHRVFVDGLRGRMIIAPVDLGTDAHVLESAAGTGIWLRDLASAVPRSLSLVGIDISTHLFPPEHPDNIAFERHSVLSLPAEWTSRFTFAHQRLLKLALRTSEWPTALGELYRVLKPGGWVQMEEYTISPVFGPFGERFQELKRAITADRGFVWPCAEQMAEMLKQAGFCHVSKETIKLPLAVTSGEEGARCRESVLFAFKGLKTPILRAGGYGLVSSEKDYDDLMAALEAEWKQTPDSHAGFIVCCGQKPSPA